MCLKFVAKRTRTKTELMMIKVIPTAQIACAREGGFTKFGGSPLGFFAKGILGGSMLGGEDSIATVLERSYRRKRQAREVGQEVFSSRNISNDSNFSGAGESSNHAGIASIHDAWQESKRRNMRQSIQVQSDEKILLHLIGDKALLRSTRKQASFSSMGSLSVA